MQADLHYHWLREIVIPAFFTLFGVALGLVANQAGEYWKAARAKKYFTRAIRIEIDALDEQFSMK